MARILLIETATEVCSTAIAVNGVVVALEEEQQSLNHAALLTLQIEACTRRLGISLADVDAVAVSSGPGSYTSLRVGASVAKGICYALDKPLIAVDTLLALADAEFVLNDGAPMFYMPMLDARRQEVWTAIFDPQLNQLMPAQPLILENDLFYMLVNSYIGHFKNKKILMSGNGVKKLENVRLLEEPVVGRIQSCSATHLVRWAEAFFQNADFQNIATWTPAYMKPPNITTSSKKV